MVVSCNISQVIEFDQWYQTKNSLWIITCTCILTYCDSVLCVGLKRFSSTRLLYSIVNRLWQKQTNKQNQSETKQGGRSLQLKALHTPHIWQKQLEGYSTGMSWKEVTIKGWYQEMVSYNMGIKPRFLSLSEKSTPQHNLISWLYQILPCHQPWLQSCLFCRVA